MVQINTRVERIGKRVLATFRIKKRNPGIFRKTLGWSYRHNTQFIVFIEARSRLISPWCVSFRLCKPSLSKCRGHSRLRPLGRQVLIFSRYDSNSPKYNRKGIGAGSNYRNPLVSDRMTGWCYMGEYAMLDGKTNWNAQIYQAKLDHKFNQTYNWAAAIGMHNS